MACETGSLKAWTAPKPLSTRYPGDRCAAQNSGRLNSGREKGRDGVSFFTVHVDLEHGDSTAHSAFQVISESEADEALCAVKTHIEFMGRPWADIDPPSRK